MNIRIDMSGKSKIGANHYIKGNIFATAVVFIGDKCNGETDFLDSRWNFKQNRRKKV